MKKKGMFGMFARRLAACAMTASLAALGFPLSAFAAGNAKLSLRHFTAGSGIAVQGDASVQVFLTSAPDTYSLERNGEKQEIRFATLSDAVRAQYGLDSAYASYATVNLYGNDAAKIDGLADGTSYFVKEDTANLSSVYAREPYYFGNQGSVSAYAETEAVSVDHRTGETPVVIRKTWDDSNNVSARPAEIKVRFDALDAEQNVIPGQSRIATVRPNADGQWYFVEGLHQLEKATDTNAVRASRSNAQLASASEAEREGEVQSVHSYRLSEVLSGGNYVLRFPATSRIRAVGQDMNFDLVNSYYFSSSSSGGRSYTGSGRMSGRSAAYRGSATNTSATVPGSNDSGFTPAANATVDGTGSLTAPSTGAALRNAGNRLAGPMSASGRKGRMPKTGQPASAAAAVFCAAGLGVLLLFRRKEEI
ncbi:hypothetical protein [Stomatobaculum longum]|uniref:hypothetical protein n=1 Tax=Stomatobaculum longum TaxID=796942 RepID=UPI0028F1050F|nr:hypothetical protein [Stomatobaculum longum]